MMPTTLKQTNYFGFRCWTAPLNDNALRSGNRQAQHGDGYHQGEGQTHKHTGHADQKTRRNLTQVRTISSRSLFKLKGQFT